MATKRLHHGLPLLARATNAASPVGFSRRMDHIVRPRGLGSLLSINVYIDSRGGMTVDVVISLAFIELYARLSAVFRSWTCAQHLKTLNSRTIEHLTGRLSTLCLVTTRQVHRSHSKPRRANTTRRRKCHGSIGTGAGCCGTSQSRHTDIVHTAKPYLKFRIERECMGRNCSAAEKRSH